MRVSATMRTSLPNATASLQHLHSKAQILAGARGRKPHDPCHHHDHLIRIAGAL
jgi:hypothetical protein